MTIYSNDTRVINFVVVRTVPSLGRAITDSLEGIIIGYFLWMMAITSYSNIATAIRMEAN